MTFRRSRIQCDSSYIGPPRITQSPSASAWLHGLSIPRRIEKKNRIARGIIVRWPNAEIWIFCANAAKTDNLNIGTAARQRVKRTRLKTNNENGIGRFIEICCMANNREKRQPKNDFRILIYIALLLHGNC